MNYEIFAMWDMDFPSEGPILYSSGWTLEENKAFEDALALYEDGTPDRWEKVAARVHGRSAIEVEMHYRDLVEDVQVIEAGLVSPPYNTSCSIEYMKEKSGELRGLKHCSKGHSAKSSEQERKKGVPWTQEEHKLFLMGLDKFGKGDWRSISRHFVVSRTPTQVASHAQKYFIRHSSANKEKRRSSIHDITTVNGPDKCFSLQDPSTDANYSAVIADMNQSMFLSYPSPLGRTQLIDPSEPQLDYNNLIFLNYPLNVYGQKGTEGGNTTRTRVSDPLLSIMSNFGGFPTHSAMYF